MLELLFQGFIEWIYGLILECWEYFASVLFDLMSLDFAYLREHMPVIDTIRQIMLGVGWALLIGNLVFQATRGMAAGLGFDAEDPKLLFTRTFAFSLDDIESNLAYVGSGLSVYTITIMINSAELKKDKTHKEIIEALSSLEYIYHIEEMR